MRLSLFFTLPLLIAGVTAKSHGPRRHNSHQITREAQNVTESEHTLAKRAFTGTGTFYYAGLGACGIYNTNNDAIVALNSAQYGGGYPGPQCFKSITISANGKQSYAQITDECPTCGYGSLDLSPSLFRTFADESAGVIDITWWFNDGSEAPAPKPETSKWVAPTSEWHAPSTSTTPAWTPDPTSTSTYVWVAPSSSSTSQWVAPSSSTSEWVAPSSSTSIWVAPSSSSSSAAASSSTSLSASSNSTSSTSSRAAFFQTASVSAVSASRSASATDAVASAGASGTPADAASGKQAPVGNNLVFLNVLAAQYGGLVVAAAEA